MVAHGLIFEAKAELEFEIVEGEVSVVDLAIPLGVSILEAFSVTVAGDSFVAVSPAAFEIESFGAVSTSSMVGFSSSFSFDSDSGRCGESNDCGSDEFTVSNDSLAFTIFSISRAGCSLRARFGFVGGAQ